MIELSQSFDLKSPAPNFVRDNVSELDDNTIASQNYPIGHFVILNKAKSYDGKSFPKGTYQYIGGKKDTTHSAWKFILDEKGNFSEVIIAELKALIESKIDKTKIVDLLTSSDIASVLSANQGRILNEMIQGGYLFKGEAKPTDKPAEVDSPLFYIALEKGTYTNFKVTKANEGLSIIMSKKTDGVISWELVDLMPIAQEFVYPKKNECLSSELGSKLAFSSVINQCIVFPNVYVASNPYKAVKTGDLDSTTQNETTYKFQITDEKVVHYVMYGGHNVKSMFLYNSTDTSSKTLMSTIKDENFDVETNRNEGYVAIPDGCKVICISNDEDYGKPLLETYSYSNDEINDRINSKTKYRGEVIPLISSKYLYDNINTFESLALPILFNIDKRYLNSTIYGVCLYLHTNANGGSIEVFKMSNGTLEPSTQNIEIIEVFNSLHTGLCTLMFKKPINLSNNEYLGIKRFGDSNVKIATNKAKRGDEDNIVASYWENGRWGIANYDYSIAILGKKNPSANYVDNLEFVKSMILNESFTIQSATYTNGIINSPLSIKWADGKDGTLEITRDDNELVSKIKAYYSSEIYEYSITRDSEGNVTKSQIFKIQ